LALPHPQHQPLLGHSYSHAVLGFVPIPCDSACVLLLEFCLGTCGRSSSRFTSFLYANKRCSSSGNHALYFLMLKFPCSSSVDDPSLSLLLRSGSLLLKISLSSLHNNSPFHRVIALASTALPCWSWIPVVSLCMQLASKAVPIVLLKPTNKSKFCVSSLIVKSSIFPT
jgi:hypothetical protein